MKLLPTHITSAGRGDSGLEARDCVVRAYSSLLGGTVETYDKAHAVLASYGRKDGHRTHGLATMAPAIGLSLSLVLLPELAGLRGTVANFIETHPAGSYLVRINGHAFAVIDGGIHDMFPVGPRSRVKQAWKVAA